jgi:hypothetical protein
MLWRVAIKALPRALRVGAWATAALQLMNEHGLFTPAGDLVGTLPLQARPSSPSLPPR